MFSLFESVLICILAWLSEFCWALTSFGRAIVFIYGWESFFVLGIGDGTILSVQIYTTIYQLTNNVLQCYLLKEFYNWEVVRFTLFTVACQVPGLLLGLWMLLRYDDEVSRRILGGILLLSAAWQTWRYNRSHNIFSQGSPSDSKPLESEEALLAQPSTEGENPNVFKAAYEAPDSIGVLDGGLGQVGGRTWWSTVVAFFLAGFGAGFYTVAGPPLMIWVFFNEDKLNRNNYRLSGAINALVKGIITIVTLILEKPAIREEWFLHLCLCVITVTALLVGNPLAKVLSKKDFAIWILAFLYASGVLMISTESASQSYVLFGSLLLGASGIAAHVAYKYCSKRDIPQAYIIQQEVVTDDPNECNIINKHTTMSL